MLNHQLHLSILASNRECKLSVALSPMETLQYSNLPSSTQEGHTCLNTSAAAEFFGYVKLFRLQILLVEIGHSPIRAHRRAIQNIPRRSPANAHAGAPNLGLVQRIPISGILCATNPKPIQILDSSLPRRPLQRAPRSSLGPSFRL